MTDQERSESHLPESEDKRDQPSGNGPEDFSGRSETIDIRAAEPKGLGLNRRLVGGAIVIAGVLMIGVVWSSVQKQRLIQGGGADENTTTIAETRSEPASTADLPSDYEELRRYNERQDAERLAREARYGAPGPKPVIPASLTSTDTSIQTGRSGGGQGREMDPNDPRLVAARQDAMQRLQQRAAALSGKSGIQTRAAAPVAEPKYAAVEQTSGAPVTTFNATPVDDTIHANQQENKQAFLEQGRASDPYLRQNIIKPASKFQVMAGSVIPAGLITGLNSDLPGRLTAQVRSNVYDSVTGEHVLIPQGARLIGEYSSRITYGQNRALVVWTRIIYPNGSSISLEGMPGVDLAGYAGFKDKVEHHFMRLFGAAVLGSLVSTGANAAEDGDDGFADDFLQGTANTADQTVQQIIRKQLNIQPTILIRPGYKFNILVMADMVLPPYDRRPAYQASLHE